MVRFAFGLVFCLLFLGYVTGQNSNHNFNIELLSHVRIEADANDVWGFTDSTGVEYAVIGSRVGTHIYSLENPKAPKLRYTAYGARSVWRDIKYYKGYLYATADQDTFGLTIIDVRKAPDSITHTQWKPQIQIGNNTGRFLRAHNLYIDSLGYAYLAGHNLSRRGVMIIDLNKDPLNPVFMSAADRFYSHDAYVQGNRLYSSELNNGFAIYDVTDKSMPVELGRARSSRNFTHNAWLSPDGNFLYTTDEVAGGTVDSYNVADPSAIRFLDKVKTQANDTRVIPHNTHTIGDYAVTSWYTDGIIIKDVSKPNEMTIVGAYDTYPQDSTLPKTGQLFFGCWGAYPYLPSGLILASDINNGLYVLKPNYLKASTINGRVFQTTATGDTIQARSGIVRYLGSDRNKIIDSLQNDYKFRVAPGKTIFIEASSPGFITDTFSVSIQSDSILVKNFYLKKDLVSSTQLDAFESDLQIFPNPSGGIFQMSHTFENEPDITVYSATGIKVFEVKNSGNKLDISHLDSGAYYIQIKAENTYVLKKILKI